MKAQTVTRIRDFVRAKVDGGVYPGCQVLVAWQGEVLVDEAYGSMIRDGALPEDRVTPRTLFNVESITKVMVTLPVAFRLIEFGLLRLDQRVVDFIPAFGTDDVKKTVTVRQLLNFCGGIPLEDPEQAEAAAARGDIEDCWRLHYEQPLGYLPGTRVVYSDVSCRILGRILELAAGMPLDVAAAKWFFEPLKMEDTVYVPGDKSRCAATGVSDGGRVLRGELTQDLEHDLGEVLGSDGLFSTARDMNVFAQVLLNGGRLGSVRVLSEASTRLMISKCTNLGICEEPTSYLHYILSGPKVWLWELAAAPYSFFGDLVSERAVGKMGGAGTFLLLDPDHQLVIVYLTNYGQPAKTLKGEEGWNKFQEDIDMMGLCNISIGGL